MEAWQKYRRLTSSQRKKLKADSYLGYRRYIKAASIYDEILDNQQDITDKVFLEMSITTEVWQQPTTWMWKMQKAIS